MQLTRSSRDRDTLSRWRSSVWCRFRLAGQDSHTRVLWRPTPCTATTRTASCTHARAAATTRCRMDDPFCGRQTHCQYNTLETSSLAVVC